jgi:Ca2+-binding EF-hand superfamily protein
VTLSPPENETQSPIGGLAGTYDSDADGTITVRELGRAVTDYARGTLTAAELGEVVTAFATR